MNLSKHKWHREQVRAVGPRTVHYQAQHKKGGEKSTAAAAHFPVHIVKGTDRKKAVRPHTYQEPATLAEAKAKDA